MNYNTPEIILCGVTVEAGLATSLSSDNQIYFQIGASDNDFANVESSN